MNIAAETMGTTNVPGCSGVGLMNGMTTAPMEARAATAELTTAIVLNMVVRALESSELEHLTSVIDDTDHPRAESTK